MPTAPKLSRVPLTRNDMRANESMLFAEALKDAKKKLPSKRSSAKTSSRNKNGVHNHISHKRLTELFAEYNRKRYKYINIITNPKKKGHRQNYTLIATKEWWGPDMEYFYRSGLQARRNERRRLLRKMKKEAESST